MMTKKRCWHRRAGGGAAALAALWMIFSPTAHALRALPDTLRLTVGEQYQLDTGAAVLSSRDETLHLAGRSLAPGEIGDRQVSVDLFGLFPVRKLRLQVGEEVRLMPGGAAVGVAMATKGVLVVGVSDVAGRSPAQSAGLRAGDVIEQVEGQDVTDSAHLSRLVSTAQGAPVLLRFRRDGALRTTRLTPMRDQSSGAWRIGAWVRDSTAGVGTLSYYDPDSGVYGALGHAINDGDTGKLLPVRTGSLLRAEIVDVRKGKKGAPGELRGSFLKDQVILGTIRENTELGIYGKLSAPYVNPLYPDGLPVGYQESVTIGPATILSTVDGGGVEEYRVEIVQKSRQIAPGPKSMVIRVTDERLLHKTGGIVQGMSGSPIVQNGRIVGAVTHVFVEDAAMGYGLYIEWMLSAAQAVEDAA